MPNVTLQYATNMAFTIDEAFLPATLTAPPMTDRQFADFCAEHPSLFFEMTATGEIIVTPPKFSLTSIRNREITSQLDRWASQDGRGLVGESSGGFVLPSGARRSPDASWIAKDAVRQLNQQSLKGYFHLCPAFVIELRSHSDRLPVLRAKMQEYIANGAQLGWLIDADARTALANHEITNGELVNPAPSDLSLISVIQFPASMWSGIDHGRPGAKLGGDQSLSTR
jgi:Uma2 family endonuclease